MVLSWFRLDSIQHINSIITVHTAVHSAAMLTVYTEIDSGEFQYVVNIELYITERKDYSVIEYVDDMYS